MASKTWIQTLSGKKLEPAALTKEMVGGIEEIAHALSLKNRFTGQTTVAYSVAEHCVRGSRLLPAAFAGAFLLHELSEVYLPDIASPLKPLVRLALTRPADPHGNAQLPYLTWSELEEQHTRVILDALGLTSIEPLIYSPEVKRMDLMMLAAEKRDFFPNEPDDWKLPEPPAETGPLNPWSATSAESEFLIMFGRLFR